MPVTVLYPEGQVSDEALEREIFGSGVTIMRRAVQSLAELSDADCAGTDGLMISRFAVGRDDLPRFPNLKCVVRMGVGYDRLDREACAERNVLVCNVPDYGTSEVADHAIALALSLRRGIIHYHDTQRADEVAPWRPVTTGGIVRRLGVQTFGILGLGRIGTAAALRAKALGFRVMFYDPHLPNGAELAIGVARART
ncbi:MAG: NAD(P)-dependent oxidoreductase, partial [Hyphomicrobiaceae bacterium]